jgi:arylsulfatase A-like enzyme
MRVREWRVLSVGAVVVLLLAGCGQEDRPQPTNPTRKPAVLADKTWPNVILISIDALRPDHLHCYGYPRETSPRIDQFAAEGALFQNVISSTSWTLPAHACMFTGLADSVHGCTDTDRRLHKDHYTLAERLQDVGYATVGFFSGPYLHPVFALNQGFETYVDCTSYPELTKQTAESSGTVEGGAIWEAMQQDITNPKVLAEVQGWLHQNPRRPFFMFIHMWDVHFDYIPPPPFDTLFDPDYTGSVTGERFFFNPKINPDMPKRDLEHLLALYDGEIRWTDQHVGQIFDELKTLKLLDGSVVIVTSDHGTAFLEHGLKGHRNSLFDEVLRIPLIVRYPPAIAAGQRLPQQVRMMDLLPTVLDLLNLSSPKPLMGQSLAPLFAGGMLPREAEPALSELDTWNHRLQSFRRPERKTIFDLEANGGVVYDLLSDPGELAPLPDRNSPIHAAAIEDGRWCRAFLKAFRQQYPQSPKISDLPDKLLEKLKSLGYIGSDD